MSYILPVIRINKVGLSLRRYISKGTVPMKCKFSSHVPCRAAKDCELIKEWQAGIWYMTVGYYDGYFNSYNWTFIKIKCFIVVILLGGKYSFQWVYLNKVLDVLLIFAFRCHCHPFEHFFIMGSLCSLKEDWL